MAREINGSLDGQGLRVGVLVSQFNETVTSRLLDGARDALARHGVREDKITIARVPGSLELPQLAKRMAESGAFDALVALGCVIRGETAHFEYVSAEAAHGIAQVARETSLPIAFGVLTTNTADQAMARSGSARQPRGRCGPVGHQDGQRLPSARSARRRRRPEEALMTIEEQLADDLKLAMRSHDDVLRDVVRLMRAALKNAEIEKRGTLDEASVETVLARMAKQYRDSIAIYRDAGRTDLSDKEEAELVVVMRYLPEQLGADEIASLARAAAGK